MDKNLAPIAKELFGKIRTQFSKIKLGDANSQVTDRPSDARFFEFDFEKHGANLGTITISIGQPSADDDDTENDGLVVMYSNGIVDDQPTSVKRQWYKFLESLSDFASSRLMKFSVRDISKSNLDKRDYNYLAKKNGESSMSESKLWGTSKTSYQNMGEAKLIVKHTQPVNYAHAAGRTLHIESIYVENSQGERFKYPVKHLNGARALATHVAHGGNPYDGIGQHITGLSEELNKLRMFKGYVDRNEMVSEAMGAIQNKVYERIDQVKKEIRNLQNRSYYENFAESFVAKDAQEIPEDVVNDWIDRLTIRTFNEELKNVFPYIYKLVGEEVDTIKELTADDLLGEDDTNEEVDTHQSRSLDVESQFEMYMNSIVDEALDSTDDATQQQAIDTLNAFLATNPKAGTDGLNAAMSLKDLIDDADFEKMLKQLPAETELAGVIKGYIETNLPELADKIEFPAPGSEPAPAPEAPVEEPAAIAPEVPAVPEVPAAPAPVAETTKSTGIAAAIAKAKKAGATSETIVNFGFGEMSLGEAIAKAGMNVEEFFESTGKQNEVIEFVKSMYDETTGNFPKGETGVLLAVEKQFGEDAAQLAHSVISELSHVYESKRLRQLAGISEGYYDLDQGNVPGMEPIDFSTKPSFRELVDRYTQLVYQGHASETSPEEDEEYDAIEQYVAKRFGEKGSAHLQKAGEVSYWGRDDKPYGRDSRSSNLGRPNQPSGDFRTTKAGKMHGQDVKMMKNKVSDRLGRHPEPNLPESSELDAMLKIAGLK